MIFSGWQLVHGAVIAADRLGKPLLPHEAVQLEVVVIGRVMELDPGHELSHGCIPFLLDGIEYVVYKLTKASSQRGKKRRPRVEDELVTYGYT